MRLIISDCSYIPLKSQGHLIALNFKITVQNKEIFEKGRKLSLNSLINKEMGWKFNCWIYKKEK